MLPVNSELEYVIRILICMIGWLVVLLAICIRLPPAIWYGSGAWYLRKRYKQKCAPFKNQMTGNGICLTLHVWEVRVGKDFCTCQHIPRFDGRKITSLLKIVLSLTQYALAECFRIHLLAGLLWLVTVERYAVRLHRWFCLLAWIGNVLMQLAIV